VDGGYAVTAELLAAEELRSVGKERLNSFHQRYEVKR